jgi:hypothetical protein
MLSGGQTHDAQVHVRVGGQTKSTAEAQGKQSPEWEETLEFALPGDVAHSHDEQIHVSPCCSAFSQTPTDLG